MDVGKLHCDLGTSPLICTRQREVLLFSLVRRRREGRSDFTAAPFETVGRCRALAKHVRVVRAARAPRPPRPARARSLRIGTGCRSFCSLDERPLRHHPADRAGAPTGTELGPGWWRHDHDAGPRLSDGTSRGPRSLNFAQTALASKVLQSRRLTQGKKNRLERMAKEDQAKAINIERFIRTV
jgi:hypothetical protein